MENQNSFDIHKNPYKNNFGVNHYKYYIDFSNSDSDYYNIVIIVDYFNRCILTNKEHFYKRVYSNPSSNIKKHIEDNYTKQDNNTRERYLMDLLNTVNGYISKLIADYEEIDQKKQWITKIEKRKTVFYDQYEVTEEINDPTIPGITNKCIITKFLVDLYEIKRFVLSFEENLEINSLIKINISRNKIHTSFTVVELTKLFYLFFSCNTFNNRNKREITRFIARNFTSKKSQNISEDSVYNHFNSDNLLIIESHIKSLKSIITEIENVEEDSLI